MHSYLSASLHILVGHILQIPPFFGYVSLSGCYVDQLLLPFYDSVFTNQIYPFCIVVAHDTSHGSGG